MSSWLAIWGGIGRAVDITYQGLFFSFATTLQYRTIFMNCTTSRTIQFTLNSRWRRTPKKHVYSFTSVSLATVSPWNSICSSLFYPKTNVILTSNKTPKNGKSTLQLITICYR